MLNVILLPLHTITNDGRDLVVMLAWLDHAVVPVLSTNHPARPYSTLDHLHRHDPIMSISKYVLMPSSSTPDDR